MLRPFIPSTRQGGLGFTSVELLVVITIIAVLIALLLPAIKKSKESARRILCASQERQVLMSLLNYKDENDGFFPCGDWPAPTVMGAGRDILISMGEPVPTSAQASAAIRTLTCPSADPFTPGDEASYWPSGEYHIPVGGLHIMYLYAGGVGNFSGMGLHDSEYWHGWRATGSWWATYDDPRNIGPVPHIDLRSRHSDTGLYTDRMWPSQGQNLSGTPIAPNNWDNPIGIIPPNHILADGSSDGGNVGHLDGHVMWRNVNVIRERLLAYGDYRPFIAY